MFKSERKRVEEAYKKLSQLLDELQIKPTPLKKTGMELKVKETSACKVKDRQKRVADRLFRSYCREKDREKIKKKVLV